LNVCTPEVQIWKPIWLGVIVELNNRENGDAEDDLMAAKLQRQRTGEVFFQLQPACSPAGFSLKLKCTRCQS